MKAGFVEKLIERLGRIGMTRDHLEAFGRTLTHDDHVIIEATTERLLFGRGGLVGVFAQLTGKRRG